MFTNASRLLMIIITYTPSLLLAEPNGDPLLFELDHFSHSQGQATVNLFRGDDEMFDHPFRVEHAQIVDGRAIVTFKGLDHGEYAAVAFHDVNANQLLDHHFLGFPNEPLGYSGGFTFGLFSGIPDFSDLRFRYSENSDHFTIHIKE